jgi:cytoskeleton protein RodZ
VDSFGKYLTRERELRAVTRVEVAQATRLSVEALVALEEDRFEVLHGEAFAVGAIRNYARCIGLSEDDAVLRFQEMVQQRRAAEPVPPLRPGRSALRRRLALGALALALALVLGATLALWFR